MHPLLFNLGPVPIHTYGLLIAIGFLCAVAVVRRLAERSNLDADRMLDLTFWCLVMGFLGARILFIITRWDSFMADPISIFKVWEGGLVFLGGPLVVVPFAVWFVKHYKIDPWKAGDCLMPALAVAHGFGRLGCLGAGCCYGKPTGSDWGVKLYSDLVDPKFHGVFLHPTQLYESAAMFALFAGLIYLFRRKSFDGQVILTYFMAYPVIRSIIEIFRGDEIRGFVIDQVLSTSQFISILIFIAAAVFLVRRLKQVRAA